jgi:hypothetical protein
MLQSGHFELASNHLSMHKIWNVWKQCNLLNIQYF